MHRLYHIRKLSIRKRGVENLLQNSATDSKLSGKDPSFHRTQDFVVTSLCSATPPTSSSFKKEMFNQPDDYRTRRRHARSQAYFKLYLEGDSLLARLKPTSHELQITEEIITIYQSTQPVPYATALLQNVRLHLSRYLYLLDHSSRQSMIFDLETVQVSNEAFYAVHTLYERALHSSLHYPDGSLALEQSSDPNCSLLHCTDLLCG